MKRFYLVRRVDVSGVSGVGTVAEGVEFDDGSGAVLHWLTQYRSTAVYPSMADLVAIHGHDGKTQVVWMDYEDSESPEIVAVRYEDIAGQPVEFHEGEPLESLSRGDVT